MRKGYIMICTLLFYELDNPSPILEAHTSILNAESAIEEYGEDIRNAQILVDYSKLEFYEKKFNEVYEIMRNKTFGPLLKDRVEI